MWRLAIRAVGTVEARIISSLEGALTARYHAPVHVLAPIEEPDAFDPNRRQYSSVALLKALMAHSAPPDAKVLGISERDLFIPMLTFVFGQAQMDGRYALVSTARLRQEFYGLPGAEALLHQRLMKEACHELGHTFALAHCSNAGCPMSLSTTIRHVDLKSTEYCEACAAHVLRRGLVPREQVT